MSARHRLKADRLARYVGQVFTRRHRWERRRPLPNRGMATTNALRAAEQKRTRRRERRLLEQDAQRWGTSSKSFGRRIPWKRAR